MPADGMLTDPRDIRRRAAPRSLRRAEGRPAGGHGRGADRQRGCGRCAATPQIAAASRDTDDVLLVCRPGSSRTPTRSTRSTSTASLLLFKDPPEHTKYRKILQTAFVPRSVAALEDRVREIVTDVLDGVVEERRAATS